MSRIILPQGGATVTVPPGFAIAVASYDRAEIYQETTGITTPPVFAPIGYVENLAVTVFGPYADGATIKIEAGVTEAFYNVGTAPTIPELISSLGAVNALDVTGDITSDMIVGGIITSTTAAAVVGTLPEGVDLEEAFEMPVGANQTWSVVNTGVDTFTVDPAAAGHDLYGDPDVLDGTSGTFKTIKVGSATFETYRIG
jgi:hypothetical protein